MINYYNSQNILISGGLIIVICFTCGYLGSRAIDKIPSDNLHARLLQAIQYSSYLFFPFFFVALMKFQTLPYLSAPDEFTTSSTTDVRHYQNIESLKMAHFSFYFMMLFGLFTSSFLLRKALKESSKD